jgi:hypothetical protein
MKLSAIEPSSAGHDLRTFSCAGCKRVERHIIESAVTEAWLQPKRAARHANAATHRVIDGHMIMK